MFKEEVILGEKVTTTRFNTALEILRDKCSLPQDRIKSYKTVFSYIEDNKLDSKDYLSDVFYKDIVDLSYSSIHKADYNIDRLAKFYSGLPIFNLNDIVARGYKVQIIDNVIAGRTVKQVYTQPLEFLAKLKEKYNLSFSQKPFSKCMQQKIESLNGSPRSESFEDDVKKAYQMLEKIEN